MSELRDVNSEFREKSRKLRICKLRIQRKKSELQDVNSEFREGKKNCEMLTQNSEKKV